MMSWKRIEQIFFDKESGYLEITDYEGNKFYGKLTDIKDHERDIYKE